MFRIFVCVKFKTIIMKRLFCITILLFMAFNIYAVTNSGETYIHLQVGIYDPDYPHGHKPQSPVLVPQIQQDGNSLILVRGCGNCLLEVSTYNNEEEVVFSVFITPDMDIVVLPENLFGNSNIKLTRGDMYFYGNILL